MVQNSKRCLIKTEKNKDRATIFDVFIEILYKIGLINISHALL